MGLMDRVLERTLSTFYVNRAKVRAEDIAKEQVAIALAKQDRLMTWGVPAGYNSAVQSHSNRISSQVLRDFSVYYPVARACINRLKTQIMGLDWAVVSRTEDKTNVKAAEQIENFFRRPAGNDSLRWRRFLSVILEDLLVLDALALARKKTLGGKTLGYLPIDASTIRVKVTESGEIPDPPAIAYEQFINGRRTAELTTDELMYDFMNARSNTPYGLAPLESLIIQVKSALAGALYNLRYFSDGNTPEGMVTLPDDWSKDEIKEFEGVFNAALMGDPKAQRKLKFLPAGSQVIFEKKPADLSFEKQELWLLQQTCSVFGVPPQDIGFTYQVNKATGEVQAQMGEERGMRPVAAFLADLFNHIIATDLGRPDLMFKWVSLDKADLREETEINDIKVKAGVMSVDEWREQDGLEGIGLGHYVMTAKGPVLVDDILNPKTDVEAPPAKKAAVKDEVKKWRKVCYNDLENGRPFRSFEVKEIDAITAGEIREMLDHAQSKDDITNLFSPYLSGADTVAKAAMALRDELKGIIET